MTEKILKGILLDEQSELSLNDLSYACCRSAEWVIELVEEGAIEPVGHKTHGTQKTPWRFSASSLQTAQTAMRLQQDLNINIAGVALVLDLLQKIESLQAELDFYKTNKMD